MISHHHSVLFVHIPKCAGQSIEMLFLRDLNLTWENRAPLLLRKRKEGEYGPQRLSHLYAYEYVKYSYISQVDFDKFYKFCVIRDPIDRIISELNYRKIKKIPEFSSVKNYIEYTIKNNTKYSDRVRHLSPQINFFFDETKKRYL